MSIRLDDMELDLAGVLGTYIYILSNGNQTWEEMISSIQPDDKEENLSVRIKDFGISVVLSDLTENVVLPDEVKDAPIVETPEIDYGGNSDWDIDWGTDGEDWDMDWEIGLDTNDFSKN